MLVNDFSVAVSRTEGPELLLRFAVWVKLVAVGVPPVKVAVLAFSGMPARY